MKRPGAGFSFGNALTFSTDDNVTFTAVSMVNDFTVSFLVQMDSFSSDRVVTGGGGNDRLYFPNSTRIQVVYAVSSYTWDFAATNVVDTWMHVVWTRHVSDGTMRMYINGVESTNTRTRTNTFSLDTLGFTSSWDGIIDEFAIKVGVEATQTNVDDLYNSGNGANFEDVMGAADIYLQMNESGTATTAVDTSSNGNDGTLNNFPTSGMWNAH